MDVDELRQSAKKAKDQLLHEKIALVRKVAQGREKLAEDALHTWVQVGIEELPEKVRQAAERGHDNALVFQVVGCTYDLRQAILDEVRRIMTEPDNESYPNIRKLGPVNFGNIQDWLAELGVTDVTSRPALKWVRTVREQLGQRSGLSRWLTRGLKLPEPMNRFLDVCKKQGLETRLLTFDDVGEIGLAVEARW